MLGVTSRLPPRPVLVGASLDGSTAMLLAGEPSPGIASAVVLVDIVSNIDPSGANRIHAFMADRMESGFDSLDEVADIVVAGDHNDVFTDAVLDFLARHAAG